MVNLAATAVRYRVYKIKTQAIENDLLLEFQWPSTKMNVKCANSY